MSARRTVRTMCPMSCHPTLCGMLVQVDDGRLVEIGGDPDNPDSRGFLCVRGHAAREIIANLRRLSTPLIRARRSEDAWRHATWDEALDLIAARMATAGPEAVGLWAGHGLFANNYGTRVGSHLLRRFANVWGCQWWNPTMICWGLGAFGLGLTGVLRLLRPRARIAHAGPPRPRARALDLAGRCGSARPCERRGGVRPQRSRAASGARPRDRPDRRWDGVDARRLGGAEQPDVGPLGDSGRCRRSLRIFRGAGRVRRERGGELGLIALE